MAYKLKTAVGKVMYGARKCTVEPVIGIIKEVLGFRQFSLRGSEAAAGEWCLVCLAFNLKRLHTLLAGDARRLGGPGDSAQDAAPTIQSRMVATRLWRGLILLHFHGSGFFAWPRCRLRGAFSPTGC